MNLQDYTTQKLQQLFDTVSHYLPTATKYVLEVTQINCVSNIKATN